MARHIQYLAAALVAAFLSLDLVGCGGADAFAQVKPLRVAALGDSITQAFMCDRDVGDLECYPRAVQHKAWPAKLAALNPALKVSTYAIGGCQLAICVSELDMSAWLPADYVVWLYGVNEAVNAVPVDVFISNMRAAIARRPGVPHIIIKPPIRFPIPDPTVDANIRTFLPQYRSALDALTGPGVVVIDPLGTTDWWCDLKRDQHPCEPAHTAIAQAVNAVITSPTALH